MAKTTIYTVESTDGGATLVIQPRTLNGEGGVLQNTDLTLYGNAAPNWGERFNENFYHLLENFAVAEASANMPQDENDIGEAGKGVNYPLQGQSWFNKTDSHLYIQTSTDPQNSPNWVKIATEIDLSSINISDIPGLQTDLNDLENNKVNRAGDTNLSGVHSYGHLVFNEGNGNVGANPDIRMTGDGLIAAENSIHLHVDGDASGSGVFNVSKSSYSISGNVNLFQIRNDGLLLQSINATSYDTLVNAAADNAIPNKKYVDDAVGGIIIGNFVEVAGDDMTGRLTVTSNLSVPDSTPVKITGNGQGTSGHNASAYQGGNVGLHVDNSVGTDTGGILVTVGDDNNDEHALKVENSHLSGSLPANRKVFSIRATSGNTEWHSGAHVILGAHPQAGVPTGVTAAQAPFQAATRDYVDNAVGSGGGVQVVEDYFEYQIPSNLSNNPFVWHGFGAGNPPHDVEVIYRCVTADWNYQIGDEITYFSPNGGSAVPGTIWWDDINIGVTNGNYTLIYVWDKQSPVLRLLNTTRWRLVIKAWRYA